MEKRNNKNKKRLLILVALVGVMGIGGVVAATSITINSGSPISLGAGYSTATSCDEAVTVSAGQGYDVSDNVYKVNSLEVSGINLWLATNSTGNGCGLKTLQMSVIYTSGSPTSTSWVLPSSSLTDSIFRFGSAANTVTGVYYNASAALTSFSISLLSTIAISIS
jgi:hypothetical protein